MPYSLTKAMNLTIHQFCKLYVAESYPEPPSTVCAASLLDSKIPPIERTVYSVMEFPICFVLGCGRSGTTLFRSMLNVHGSLWAPGELHLAQYDTMAQRASLAGSILRYSFIPEVAERLGISTAEFAERLATWEQESVPTSTVYDEFYRSSPAKLIVDKTPSYSVSQDHLAWIVRHFKKAKFLHIVRNPYDVIRSLIRIQLYKTADAFHTDDDPYHIAESTWYWNNINITEALRGVAERNKLSFRYEDLIADPQKILSEICSFLGVEYDPMMEDPYAANTGRVAVGAGDPLVNQATKVEQRVSGGAFPLRPECETLAKSFGY